MQVHRFVDPVLFLSRAELFLMRAEVENKRGYASACVAGLTQRLLDEGHAFCCLCTDLANPTSNRIYQTIGYRPVCDMSDFHFEPG
jgi:hypothetical protein